MSGPRHAVWSLLLAPACFHPSYDHPRCGPNGECPGGLTCSAQLICESRSGEDASSTDSAPLGCWSIAAGRPQVFNVSACPAAIIDSIHLTTNTDIDTDDGTSFPAGLTCASLTNTPAPAI